MFYNKEESFFARYFGGGGGSPKMPEPEPVETKHVEEYAGEEELKARKRKPPGRKATIFTGIQKALEERQTGKSKLGE